MSTKATTAGRKARILVVDDHPIIRQGLARLIEPEPDLVVEAGVESSREALDMIFSGDRFDMAIIDITLGGANGIELIKSIRARTQSFPILVLSMHDESLYAERALRAGAQGYVMKHEAPEQLVGAIRKVLGGGVYLSEAMSSRVVAQMVAGGPRKKTGAGVERLSDRELEVLELIGRGLGTRQIAESLHLSVKTIETHRAHIKSKLRIGAAPELVRFAVEWVNSQGARSARVG